jgi:hypothetical protein
MQMIINRWLLSGLLSCILLFTFVGCASTPTAPQGGFRIADGSGQQYYARNINFVGSKGGFTMNMRDWGAKEFNMTGLPYIENGDNVPTGTLSFVPLTSRQRVTLDGAFRVDVISEEELLKSLNALEPNQGN